MHLLLIFFFLLGDIGMLCKLFGPSALWYVRYILYVPYLKIGWRWSGIVYNKGYDAKLSEG